MQILRGAYEGARFAANRCPQRGKCTAGFGRQQDDSLLGIGRIVPYITSIAADWLPDEVKPHLRTLHQDIVLIQAAVFVCAMIIVGVNLVADVLYTIVDPRVEIS